MNSSSTTLGKHEDMHEDCSKGADHTEEELGVEGGSTYLLVQPIMPG